MSTPQDPRNSYTQPAAADGKAVGSMVCGILGLLCVLPIIGSLIAVILGHMSLSDIKRSQGQLSGQGMAVAGLVTGYMGFVWALFIVLPIFAGMLLPVLSKSREKARRVNCAGNLKQIGLACLMYSGENSGFYPLTAPGSNFEPLNTEGILNDGKVYGCPSAPVMHTSARNTGYLYLGSGIKDDNENPTQVVIACDRSGNHPDGMWINALFADGHVEGTKAGSIEEAAQKRGWIIPNPPPPQQAPQQRW